MLKRSILFLVIMMIISFSSCSSKEENEIVESSEETTIVEETTTEIETTIKKETIKKIKSSNLDNISGYLCINYGKYKNEDVEWLIIDKNDDGVLLLSKNIIDCKNYNEEDIDVVWNDSTLRQWLNTTFLEELTDVDTNVFYSISNFSRLIDPSDKVSLLSINLCEKYFGVEDANRQNLKILSKVTDYAKSRGMEFDTNENTEFYNCGSFFLIDNGDTTKKAAWVGMYGKVYKSGQDVKLMHGDGIRPIIALKSEAFDVSLLDNINNNLFNMRDEQELLDQELSNDEFLDEEFAGENTSNESFSDDEDRNYIYTNISKDKYKSQNLPLKSDTVIDLTQWKYGGTPIEWIYVGPNIQLISNTSPNMSDKFGYKQGASSGTKGCYIPVYTNCDEVKGVDYDGRMFVIEDNNNEKYPLDTLRFKNSLADLMYKDYNVLELLKKRYEMNDISKGIYMAGDVYVNVIYVDLLDRIIDSEEKQQTTEVLETAE